MNPSEAPGLRGRFIPAAPPAPVPEPRAQEPEAPRKEDRSRLTAAPKSTDRPGRGAGSQAPGDAEVDAAQAAQTAPVATRDPGRRDQDAIQHADAKSGAEEPAASPQGEETDGDVVRETGSMAIATLISRITGFIRNVLIGASLGSAISSAFNTANTLPNLITEIVLGAVLTSLVVPVLVRAEKEDADHGAAFVRRLFTLAFTLLGAVTVAAVLAAPLLTRMTLGEDGEVNITQSTSFAYLVLPQILFYGLFSLFMAVLNTKGVFKPGAWAPVANNVVSISVLLAYRFLPGGLDPNAASPITDPHVLLLGLGTTAGVVVQMLILLPALRRAGVDLRPLWGIDERLKSFGGMALAIVVYVAISQLGWIITTNIASASSAAAPNIYQQHWLLLQVPYGIIGVTLLTALMPRLSRNAADGDDKAVVRDLTLATKLTFIALIPIVVFFTVFGRQIGVALFHYGAFERSAAELLGLTLSFSAFTLIPYAMVLLHLRVFYAREEAWTPTWIIAGITATKVALSMAAPVVASSPEYIVILLGAANGFGFVAGAAIGGYQLRQKLGPLGGRTVAHTSAWALGAGVIGAGVAWGCGWLIDLAIGGAGQWLGSFGELLRLGVLGVIFLVATGIVLSRSRLPEVQNLGALAQRVPFLGRFVHPDSTNGIETGEATTNEINQQYLAGDSFAATPVPPPMSAGVVRGPRLVPGAPVSDGRFRLLVEHGSASGARFWEALERATGRRVALVFVDTTGRAPLAPATPEAAAGTAGEVRRRTRKLAQLHHPAIAGRIEVATYPSGCLIVADWVEGSPLKVVAEEGNADPRAAAFALSPLADAVGRAHATGTPLGLDNWARIRINTSGTAVLAFPAVLPDADQAEDSAAIASALGLLVDKDSAPEDVWAAVTAARSGEADPIELSRRLHRAGLGAGESAADAPAELKVNQDVAPSVDDRAGFGARGLSGKGTGILAVLVFLAVVGIAAAAAYLTGVLGEGEDHAPVSVPGTTVQRTPDRLPMVQPVSGARVLSPGAEGQDPEEPESGPQGTAGGEPGGVDNQEAQGAVDGDPDTFASVPAGHGVELTLRAEVPVRTVVLTIDQEAEYRITTADGRTISSGDLRAGHNVQGVAHPVRTDRVVVWFDRDVQVSEASVVGQQTK